MGGFKVPVWYWSLSAMHWSYCSLALSHQYILHILRMKYGVSVLSPTSDIHSPFAIALLYLTACCKWVCYNDTTVSYRKIHITQKVFFNWSIQSTSPQMGSPWPRHPHPGCESRRRGYNTSWVPWRCWWSCRYCPWRRDLTPWSSLSRST